MKIYSGKSPVVEILNSMQDSKIVDEFYAIVKECVISGQESKSSLEISSDIKKNSRIS